MSGDIAHLMANYPSEREDADEEARYEQKRKGGNDEYGNWHGAFDPLDTNYG